MGFGLLFIGYFFLIFFPLSRIAVLPNIALIGCLVMLLGMKRLIHYCADNRAFKLARAALVVLSTVCVCALMLDVAEIDGMLHNTAKSVLAPITNSVYAISITAFTAALLVGIYKLSNEVELPGLAKRSAFVLSLNVAYTVAELAASVCSLVHTLGNVASESFTILTGYIGIVAFLFAYLILFFNMWLIFSCYARICLEGDEDMPYNTDIFDKMVDFTKRNKK